MTVEARPGKPRERTCIGCRKRSGPADLLRMTVSGGLVLPDPAHRAPGRGAHLHPVAECFDLAVRRKAFPRAFRVPGPLDASAVRDYVGQCNKNGNATEVTKAATRPPAAV
ncbi:hypothetical protein EV646_101848 [Kribbella antiqua]|uniref:YlxR domain-containing protein n=1 Tax=Kribbella antiqua TaxID=2512217 RepID=A0A4R2J3A5_9ACTN|nr:hypothetical protein EV646_101848 [Kribbella antiqua]